MRKTFSLFQSHLDLAHAYWMRLIQPGDWVIDATCGNGQDTLVLCQLALTHPSGRVYAIDIQSKAIELTQFHLKQKLLPEMNDQVYYQLGCHSKFPESITEKSISVIAYNLGYLPGHKKDLTTQTDTTLQSLEQALLLVKPGGAISITCYPGHSEGAREQGAILDFVKKLSPADWNCCHHQWLNRQNSPSLLLLQKAYRSLITENQVIDSI